MSTIFGADAHASTFSPPALPFTTPPLPYQANPDSGFGFALLIFF